MARRSEAGIEYFPMNSDIIHNPKVKLVVAEFGSKTTWAVLLPLYCKIYREKGYWIDWLDEDSKLLFAQDECKIEKSVVEAVVTGCIRRSLFDKGVFDLFGVLTSDRIQQNFLTAKKRNKSVEFIHEFSVLSDNEYKLFENVNIIGLDVNIITKKVSIKQQKKKEKEILDKEGDGEEAGAQLHTLEDKELFKEFQQWIIKNTPRVNQLKQPLTIDEFLKLRKKLSKDVLIKVLKAMQNRADLLKKYVSAYLTICNWSSREETSLGEAPKSDVNEKLKAAFKTNGPNEPE